MNIRKWGDAFEHRVIFRLARLLPLGIGGLATLALVVCLLVLVYALLPSIEPKQPDEIPAQTPEGIILAAAIGELNQLLVKAGLSFVDVTEQRCMNYYYEQCYDWCEVTLKEGVSERYFQVLSIYGKNDGAERVEYSVHGMIFDHQTNAHQPLSLNHIAQSVSFAVVLR